MSCESGVVDALKRVGASVFSGLISPRLGFDTHRIFATAGTVAGVVVAAAAAGAGVVVEVDMLGKSKSEYNSAKTR